MNINNEYIKERIKFWIDNKRQEQAPVKKKYLLSKLKMLAPKEIRGLIEWYFYPLIAGRRRKALKRGGYILMSYAFKSVSRQFYDVLHGKRSCV